MRSYVFGLVCLALFAQTATPVFDAASIKPSPPSEATGAIFQFTPGGGVSIKNATLRGLMEMAYNVRDFQISGGPAWVNSERYDIVAKPAGVDPPADEVNNGRLRMRALLADRFQLKVHKESKEEQIYALVVAKGGPKLTEAEKSDKRGGIQSRCGRMTGTSTTMANLAFILSRELRRPVLDQTGLTAPYNFQMQWMPDEPCSDTAEGPSFFTAIQQQLGIKLDTTKGPVEIVVIDYAQKASEN